jgi:hypothetical protein
MRAFQAQYPILDGVASVCAERYFVVSLCILTGRIEVRVLHAHCLCVVAHFGGSTSHFVHFWTQNSL